VGLLLGMVSNISLFSSLPFYPFLSAVLTSQTVYYFFNDIYPANHNGQRPLDPPVWWQRLIRGNAVVDAELRQQARPAADTAAAPAVQLQ
jgi:hypothetical protein